MTESISKKTLVSIGEQMCATTPTAVTMVPTMERSGTSTVETEDTVGISKNRVDVDIEPDVKSNQVELHLCSCSLVFHCFSREA